MALQDALEAAKAELEPMDSPHSLPVEAVRRLREATLGLTAFGQAGRAKHAGELAPAFRLPGPGGVPVTLNGLLSRGPLVIKFFCGGWCPYCRPELEAFGSFRSEVERH